MAALCPDDRLIDAERQPQAMATLAALGAFKVYVHQSPGVSGWGIGFLSTAEKAQQHGDNRADEQCMKQFQAGSLLRGLFARARRTVTAPLAAVEISGGM
jgi:hypothetical protein